MNKKYDKWKLGVIHPLMDKLPKNEGLERISDEFVIKGENLRKFQKWLKSKIYPNYLLKPFAYVTRVIPDQIYTK